MNCDEARRHWNLYHDSEGEAELYFQINDHLDGCPACAQWFHQQSHLEDLITEKLRSCPPVTATPELWQTVLAGSGLEPPAVARRKWIFFGGVALVASLLVAVLLWPGQPDRSREGGGSADLARLTAETHEQLVGGRTRPEFVSNSDFEVEEYLGDHVSFPVRCPPRKDTGFLVAGAGVSQFAGSEAAYLVGHLDGRPISIFLIPKEDLRRFPHQYIALQKERIHRCREGRHEMVMAVIDGSIVLVIGQADPRRLERVLRAYGTYPHA